MLIIGYGSNLGGIETFIFNLIKNFDLNRFHYSFLSNKGSTPIFYDELVSLNCNFYEITTKSQGYSKYLKDLKDLYINNHFDIIHITYKNVFFRIILSFPLFPLSLLLLMHLIENLFFTYPFFSPINCAWG